MSAYKNYLSSNIENFNLILSEMPENIIRQITFSLYSTEEIDKYAVVDINNNSATGAGSVRDPRLGAHSNSSKCDVCSKGMSECIGHYGKIRIPPLMNPIATKAIASVLTSVCNSCGKLLVSIKDLERRNIFRFKKENRLDKIKTIVVSEKKRCTNKQCQINPIYSIDSKNSYYLNMKIGDNQVSKIVPVKMLEILNRIDDETAFNLGFEDSHPRNMIMERVIVMPYCVRPDVRVGNRENIDHFTTLYQTIVKMSNQYNGLDNETLVTKGSELLKGIYFYISVLIRNEGRYNHKNESSFSDIEGRMNGKKGLIKGNMMGKRVNYAGRTVVGPGPDLRVDEIGIPRIMANKLSRSFICTEFNREYLQSRYDEGKVLSVTVKRSRGRVRAGVLTKINKNFLKYNPNFKVELGDKIDRTLEDGDMVPINRQPTLHRESILAPYIRVTDQKIITINLSITTPLNADFDGDELNIHVPQTSEAMIEAENIVAISNNLINSEDNSLLIGIIYDTPSSLYLLTNYQERYFELKNKDNLTEKELRELKSIIIDYNIRISDELAIKLGLEPYNEEFNNLMSRFNDLNDKERKRLTNLIIFNPIPVPQVLLDKLNINSETSESNGYDLLRQGASLLGISGELSSFDQIMMRKSVYDNGLATISSPSVSPFSSKPTEINSLPTLSKRLYEQGVPWGSSRAYISSCLPPGFYYNKNNILIKDGILIKGRFTKKALNKSGGIIQEMIKSMGTEVVINFMSEIQFISKIYLDSRGLTVTLNDCIPPSDEFKNKINEIVTEARVEIEALDSIKTKNKVEKDIIEEKISRILSNLKNKSDNIASEYIDKDNALSIMANSGAKGSLFNMTQMISLIGQQNTNGVRNAGDLPIFPYGKVTPESKGFCKSSFSSGLTLPEFFQHMQSSREGLINTAINTGVTGYLHAQLVKFLEDIMIAADGSVRDAKNTIIQPIYGGDGFDARELQNIGEENTMFRDLNHLIDILNDEDN